MTESDGLVSCQFIDDQKQDLPSSVAVLQIKPKWVASGGFTSNEVLITHHFFVQISTILSILHVLSVYIHDIYNMIYNKFASGFKYRAKFSFSSALDAENHWLQNCISNTSVFSNKKWALNRPTVTIKLLRVLDIQNFNLCKAWINTL